MTVRAANILEAIKNLRCKEYFVRSAERRCSAVQRRAVLALKSVFVCIRELNEHL